MTAAALAAGTAIAGGAAASTSKAGKAQTQTTTSEPWGPQAAHLQVGYQHALDNFHQQINTPAWDATNPTTAGLNDTQRAALGTATGYAQGQGAALAGQAGQTAGALLGAGGDFVSNAGALAQRGAGQANRTASGVLSQAAQGGALATMSATGQAGQAGQMGALGTAQGLAQQGQGDLNPSIQAAAQGYVNSDLVNSQVDAATRDVARTLGEETLPGLNTRAMSGGNLNSARAGAAEAVARRGAEDRAADISAAIRGDAYSTGIQAALTANSQQNALALGANQQAGALSGAMADQGEAARQFDTSTRVGAAQSLGSLDTANRSLDAQTRLQANDQLGNATSLGFQGALDAGSLASGNAEMLYGAGSVLQQEEQRQLDQAKTQYYADLNNRNDALATYYGIVGGENRGGTTTTTTPGTGPNVLGGVLGGAMLGVGLNNAISRERGGYKSYKSYKGNA